MGEKGSQRTGAAKESAERFVAALAPLGDVTSKGMFGGYGIFRDGSMFGLVDSVGEWFLKANDDAQATAFQEAGSRKHGRMPYWSVPATVTSDEATLHAWARDAADA